MRNSGLYRQLGRFLGYIEGSPSIKYKSHHFTKYRVIGKQRVRERVREVGGGEQVVRRHGRHWNKVQRRIDGRDDKEPLLVCGSELTYLKY